jgi:hypothetical protein
MQLFRYWSEIRGSRQAPFRSDLSPAAIARLLPSVMLLETGPDANLRFRLAGTRLCAIFCEELKGEPFLDLFRPSDRQTLRKILGAVENRIAIAVADVTARNAEGRAADIEVLLLPMQDDPTVVLGMVAPFSLPCWLGVTPAIFELTAIRYLDPETGLSFLKNRPSVSVPKGEMIETPGFRAIAEDAITAPLRKFAHLRVFEGGKSSDS